jgi:ArsR family metal-binding transcriptional regulator
LKIKLLKTCIIKYYSTFNAKLKTNIMKKVITTFAALALIVSVTSCRETTDKTKEAVETVEEKAVEAVEAVGEAVEVAKDSVVEVLEVQKLTEEN